MKVIPYTIIVVLCLPDLDTGLDHVTPTITANLASLLEEDPVSGPQKVVIFGSRLLNSFCQQNWIGPFQPDLECTYADSRVLVFPDKSAHYVD